MTAMRSPIPTALAACAIVLGALTGCGGSGTLSKHELIVKGDAVCETGQRRFAQISAVPPTSAKQASELTAKLIASATAELNGLKGLDPPSDLKPKLDAYIKAKEEALSLLKQRKAAADKADEGTYGKLVTKLASGQPERVKLAQAVGFKQCSRPPAPVPAAKAPKPTNP
jgi:hypothetical protein